MDTNPTQQPETAAAGAARPERPAETQPARNRQTPLERPANIASQRAPYNSGNIPPRRAEYIPKPEILPFEYQTTTKGSRQPLEATPESFTLEISKHSPQLWPELIEKWKSTVIRDYSAKNFQFNGQQMIQYLERFTKVNKTLCDIC